MPISIAFLPKTCFKPIPGKLIISFALSLLLSACGGGGGGSSGKDSPAASVPLTALSNVVVAYPDETGELTLYAGQSRQRMLHFRTSDGGSASSLVLGLPAGGLPAGWSISGDRNGCDQVDGAEQCQLALTYAPVAAEPSTSATFPYSYRDNKGSARTGSIAIAYSAMSANAATATLLPGGLVRGMAGKTSSVVLNFGTNDGSPATALHVESDPVSLPAGWTITGGGLDCANFGAGASCQMGLTYAPVTYAPASVLVIKYRYKDSGGKEQAATASIDYSATGSNTVDVSLSPAGVVRARAGSSQQVKLTFAPSDINPASSLRLLTDPAKLLAEWAVKTSTLPCEAVDGNGGCSMTLVYTPGPDQPAGKLDIDYAYTDAIGRELAGKASVAFASHDYQAYVTDYGGVEDNKLTGGVRQCELDSNGKLSACVKADTTWPLFGANNVTVYGGHAYIGAYAFAAQGVPPKPVTVCKVADDNALVDCAASGGALDQLASLQVSRLGAFIISAQQGELMLAHCKLANDGRLDTGSCGTFNTLFKNGDNGNPVAMTASDTRAYITAKNLSNGQKLYSCSMLPGTILNCDSIPVSSTEQVVQRMSSGQTGGKNYLYLATTSRTDPEKVAGSIIKCTLDANGFANGCENDKLPPGISEAEMIRVSDLRIAGNSAYLVTGATDTSKSVYRCLINQVTGDLEACFDAGKVDGKLNFGIAVR